MELDNFFAFFHNMKFLSIFFITILCLGQSLMIDECSYRIDFVRNEIGEKCVNQLEKLCNNKDWLLAFWDSSTRVIHNGLTATNNQDLGNYDLCMSIDENGLKGKFCPFQWATTIPKELLKEAIAVMELKNHINIPIPSLPSKDVVNVKVGTTEEITLLGSMCIPDGCTPEEFTKVFNPYVYPVFYKNSTANCVTKDDITEMSTFQIVVTICICIILLIVVCSTAYHIWLRSADEGEPHDIIKAFSVLHNGQKLVEISRDNPDQIQCIHGLRFFSMLWVIAGHTFASEEILPLFNVKDAKEWRSHLYAQYILAGPYAVDTFFFLSGFLLAYGYMKQMKGVRATKQIMAIPLMILHRYLRLTPAVAAMFFVSISFLKSLGNGPIWVESVESVNKPCTDYWWRFFFYLQNYSSAICYTQTWYLSADMQMFIAAPIVLIPAAIYFRKNLYWVIASLVGLIVFCVGLTITILYTVDNYNYPYDTHSRLSDYLVGIIGGIIMHTMRGKTIKIKKVVSLAVWVVTLAVMIFLVLYLNDIIVHPTVDKTNYFYPIQRPIWSACILWIVISCHFGYGGIINKFLSISCFQIGSRLSYCMYCIHGMIILYNVGSIRSYQYFSDYAMIYLFFGNTVVCLILSTIWTLTFESPMIILNKMLLGKLGSPKK
ncbi:O-acyltransferase like protein-like isoform X1 [Harmonia axyridis]|uniref:O-acyltransferase like protein-like isoform X1 n=1 Tax=Harmonia axyridis TaxID=115357 RepID=UPI001E278CC4|nr:O-acyltransferase like protein-like isoform X1 [Harmonia axyridis]